MLGTSLFKCKYSCQFEYLLSRIGMIGCVYEQGRGKLSHRPSEITKLVFSQYECVCASEM